MELSLAVTTRALVALPKIKGITTNLTPEQLSRVMKAIDEKQVVWDEKESTVFESSAAGEFDFEGERFSYTEAWEVPESLVRIAK